MSDAPKRIPKKPAEPAPAEPAPPAAPTEGFTVANRTPPAAFLRRQGISLREVTMVEKYADALAVAREALLRGDADGIRAVAADLTYLQRDAEKVRGILRKAISRAAHTTRGA